MTFVKNLIPLFLLATISIGCKKEQSASSAVSSNSTFVKLQFRGKTYDIQGKAFAPAVGDKGVSAEITSEQTSSFLNSSISGVFSVISLYASSKDVSLELGAIRKGTPVGVYGYQLLGKTNFSNENIYQGVLYDYLVSTGLSPDVLLGPQYLDPEIFQDYTDGGKIYQVVSSQSSITITEASGSKVAGTFDLTCRYGNTSQKVTGSFNYLK